MMKKRTTKILTLAVTTTIGLSVNAMAAEQNASLQNTKIRFDDGAVQTIQCYNVDGFNFIRARDVSNCLNVGIRPTEKGIALDTTATASGNTTERLTKQRAMVRMEKGQIDFDGTASETECFLLDGRYYFKLADFQKASEAHLQADETAQSCMTVTWNGQQRIVDVRLDAKNNVKNQSTDTYAAEVVRLVNIEREKENLAPLELQEDLQKAANIRAAELNTVFSHDRPDGTSCFTVLEEVGISAGTMGENIALGYPTPAQVVDGWMHSQGHRENIMHSAFTKIGVGYDSKTGAWVQLFIG